MEDGVAGAGEEAAPAGLADTERMAERPVRLEWRGGQDPGEEHPRAELRRKEHEVETEGSKSRLDGRVGQRERAAGVPVRVVVVRVGVHRRDRDRGGGMILEGVDELEADLLEG